MCRRNSQRGNRRNTPRTERFGVRRFLLSGLAALLVVLLAPYVVAPFYRVVDPVSMPMIWRWANGARVRRIFVPLDRISPALRRSVIVAEDASFCHNPGIDLGEIREALLQSDDDIEDARGASTITQQTAKNLFLWPGHSIVRKVLEIPLALWLTLVLPKRRILEIYLNIAEWGPNGDFGAEAGARHAFGVSARALSPWQAAELAAILPNPYDRSARRPSLEVRRLAVLYERRADAHPALAACAH
jgi:monofunctional glycosyltransferase